MTSLQVPTQSGLSGFAARATPRHISSSNDAQPSPPLVWKRASSAVQSGVDGGVGDGACGGGFGGRAGSSSGVGGGGGFDGGGGGVWPTDRRIRPPQQAAICVAARAAGALWMAYRRRGGLRQPFVSLRTPPLRNLQKWTPASMPLQQPYLLLWFSFRQATTLPIIRCPLPRLAGSFLIT